MFLINKLEGPVPANGMLRTINPNDLVGNAGLCGGVLPPCSQNPAYRQRSSHAKHIVTGWIIGMSSLLAVTIAVFGAWSLYKRWYSNGSCFEERFEMGKGEWPWRLLAFQRLGFTSNDILLCIKESNVIGTGGTGIVYKAEMPRLNAVVAVKKLWRTGSDIEVGSSDDLVGEVNLLGRLRHRNIVRLLGFLHNDKDAMIVYEYMQNGSLGEAMHGKQGGRLLVDWVSRKIRDNISLEEALDPNVGNCKHVQEEMLLVLRIALLCTAKLPKERPTMRDIITMLGEAKPRRKSSSVNPGNVVDKEKPIFSASPVNGLL
ncbi:leucine-rich repeat transmembrane protein kinase family protein [Actinidia rufa]|uniref:non-specific serine/threonine protein kinase n=1 Tax=Actinidia rufa TaxID=165716 RepID=A0A7J0GRT1_9ERIC|nr:leucine-rich repeat transmembrane protein kinase family protein [Actinidia rufa]